MHDLHRNYDPEWCFDVRSGRQHHASVHTNPNRRLQQEDEGSPRLSTIPREMKNWKMLLEKVYERHSNCN